jgi:hypothetical protein
MAVESSRSDPMSNDCDALSALPMPLLLSMYSEGQHMTYLGHLF